MHRVPLLSALDEYEQLSRKHFAHFTDEEERLQKVRAFVNTHTNCFDRENLQGHLTASAFILSPDLQKVLLTFHAKHKKWLQLGGHADGHPLLHEVAMREAQEESGTEKLCFFNKILAPFDLDIHLIPPHKGICEHYHYDLRYLLLCENETAISISHESLDLRWIRLNQVATYTQESSVLRQVDKVLSIIK